VSPSGRFSQRSPVRATWHARYPSLEFTIPEVTPAAASQAPDREDPEAECDDAAAEPSSEDCFSSLSEPAEEERLAPKQSTLLSAKAPSSSSPTSVPGSSTSSTGTSQPFSSFLDNVFTRMPRSRWSVAPQLTAPPASRKPPPHLDGCDLGSDSHLELLQLLLGPRSPLPQTNDGVDQSSPTDNVADL
jgi:hypothetical protein